MTHGDFTIGGTFRVGESEWRCTDICTCTIIAIRIDSVSVSGSKPEPHVRSRCGSGRGLVNGPPYAVAARVFGEYDVDSSLVFSLG
jgi:hypothetical protein